MSRTKSAMSVPADDSLDCFYKCRNSGDNFAEDMELTSLWGMDSLATLDLSLRDFHDAVEVVVSRAKPVTVTTSKVPVADRNELLGGCFDLLTCYLRQFALIDDDSFFESKSTETVPDSLLVTSAQSYEDIQQLLETIIGLLTCPVSSRSPRDSVYECSAEQMHGLNICLSLCVSNTSIVEYILTALGELLTFSDTNQRLFLECGGYGLIYIVTKVFGGDEKSLVMQKWSEIMNCLHL